MKKSMKADKKHCVVDTKTGTRDCFATLGAAKKHLAGLNARAPRSKKAGGCGCGV
jgi:hypothetical protein